MPRRSLILPASLLLFLGAALLAGNFLYKTATILVNGEVKTQKCWGLTVEDCLVSAGIPIYQGDVITPPLPSWIADGETIEIQRAYWAVIEKNGETSALWTAENVPARLLQLAGIELSPSQQVVENGISIEVEKPLPYRATHTLQVVSPTRVRVDENGVGRETITLASTLGEALFEAGIALKNGDQLKPPASTPLTGDEVTASIKRAQEVAILVPDGKVSTFVLAEQVGQALAQAGISLQGADYSIPAEEEPLPADGIIQVVRVHQEVVLEEEVIPFGITYQPLAELELDQQRVVQVGEYGLRARRIRVVYENGVEVSRSMEAEWIAKEPRPRIIGYGTKIIIRTANTPEGPIEYWRAVDVYATSYSPCNIGVPGKCGYVTASGKTLEKGMIAVIRSWFNVMRGAPVYVTSYGFATIEDIGAGFSDRHWIDLAFSDEEYRGWSGWVTLYFLTPVPENIMYILE